MAWVLVALLGCPASVWAAPPTESSSAVPPVLRDFVQAERPPERPDEAVVVTLRLTIDTTGAVTEAEVVESRGEAFDDAARTAALGFVFDPARVDGQARAARIVFQYAFDPAPAPAPTPAEPELPPPGNVAGQVFEADTQTPLAGVLLRLSGDAGTFEVRSDADGSFALDDVPPGRYELTATSDGNGTLSIPLVIEPGESATPVLRMVAAARAAPPIEVTVVGESEAERLRQSAQAVSVVETEEARRRSADLGEVLARTSGVGVRRGGGLGSGTRFSLNGLTGDQIRFFVDGVPLHFAGYPFGIANVPVNLVDRAEIYRGVVPVRFGADALGGAVNLVTDDDVDGTHGGLSYQMGSFGTHRMTASVRHKHDPSGYFVRAVTFIDSADNDYRVQVEVPNDVGQLSEATVHRFHDGYRAVGGNVETGVVDRSWADRLLVRAFVTDARKDIQHNVVMTVPYGEVEFGRMTTGASARYSNRFAGRFRLGVIGGYAYTATEFQDLAECVYDWFGRCIFDRATPGELVPGGADQILHEHAGYGRVSFEWRIHPQHALRASLSPTYTTREGEDRLLDNPDAVDPLTAQRDLMTWVNGVEYELNLFSDRVENIAFAKHYTQLARSEEPLPGGRLQARDRDTHRGGVGNALRVRIVDSLYAKASYEWATRLPRPNEIFGDGVRIVDNLELRPEVSHNVNGGLTFGLETDKAGDWRADVNGFLREVDDLIVLLGTAEVFSYHNVFEARSTGVEASAGWTSPGDYGSIDGNVTYVDFRNTSTEGPFGDFDGDRIPNRPYLTVNGSAKLAYQGIAAADARDQLSLSWNTRYVREFFRGWESVGLVQFKQTVPSQLLHTVGLTYLTRGTTVDLSFTGEIQNVTDQQAFDFFGVQRPGRAFYFKTTLDF
ncbi:MAG: TonB-dependent siderophore myxochelin receptor MxcH [Myxococcota bacterium]